MALAMKQILWFPSVISKFLFPNFPAPNLKRTPKGDFLFAITRSPLVFRALPCKGRKSSQPVAKRTTFGRLKNLDLRYSMKRLDRATTKRDLKVRRKRKSRRSMLPSRAKVRMGARKNWAAAPISRAMSTYQLKNAKRWGLKDETWKSKVLGFVRPLIDIDSYEYIYIHPYIIYTSKNRYCWISYFHIPATLKIKSHSMIPVLPCHVWGHVSSQYRWHVPQNLRPLPWAFKVSLSGGSVKSVACHGVHLFGLAKVSAMMDLRSTGWVWSFLCSKNCNPKKSTRWRKGQYRFWFVFMCFELFCLFGQGKKIKKPTV